MDSPLGADDSMVGALSSDERAALAAWADEADPSDGFTDKVLSAWIAERATEESRPPDDLDDRAEPAAAEQPRRSASAARTRRVVAWAATLAAAAAVMLMVRVLPRASGAEHAGGPTCNHDGDAHGPPSIARLDPAAAPEAGEPEHLALGSNAATVLARHCSPCHDSGDPDAKAGALDVFDVEQSYWWSTMSDAQLEDARDRIRAHEAATDDERRHMNAFVDAELRRRARAG